MNEKIYTVYNDYGYPRESKKITEEFVNLIHGIVVQEVLNRMGEEYILAEFLYNHNSHIFYLTNSFFAFMRYGHYSNGIHHFNN